MLAAAAICATRVPPPMAATRVASALCYAFITFYYLRALPLMFMPRDMRACVMRFVLTRHAPRYHDYALRDVFTMALMRFSPRV